MTVPPELDTDVAGKPARAASDPNGPTGRLATWLADTTLDDIPPPYASTQSTCCSTASPARWWVRSSRSPVRAWKVLQPSTAPGAPR